MRALPFSALFWKNSAAEKRRFSKKDYIGASLHKISPFPATEVFRGGDFLGLNATRIGADASVRRKRQSFTARGRKRRCRAFLGKIRIFSGLHSRQVSGRNPENSETQKDYIGGTENAPYHNLSSCPRPGVFGRGGFFYNVRK